MKALIVLLLGLFVFLPIAAQANCDGGCPCCPCPGIAKCMVGGSCQATCYPNSGGGNNTNNTYNYQLQQQQQQAEQARRAQEEENRSQEAQRRAEEAARRQTEFLRDRDDAASSLKGGMDNGSGGLKGMSTPSTSELRDGSSSEPVQTADKDPCPPSQDSSVVDLCFLGDKPGVIDPRVLKNFTPREKTLVAASTKQLAKATANYTEYTRLKMLQDLELLGNLMLPDGKRWPGPANPGQRLYNLDSEPALHQAFLESLGAVAEQHIKAETKIAAPPKPETTGWVVERQEADPKFMKTKQRILDTLDLTMIDLHHKSRVDLAAYLDSQGPDWKERLKSDGLFKAQVSLETQKRLKEMDRKIDDAHKAAFQQMTVLVDRWMDANLKH